MLRPYRTILRASHLRLSFPSNPPNSARSVVICAPVSAHKQSIRPQNPLNILPRSPIAQYQFPPSKYWVHHVFGARTAVKVTRDPKQEDEARKQPFSKRPDPNVSTVSSVTPILGGRPVNSPKKSDDDVDMLKGIKNDLQTVRETFALRDVPRQPLYFGLAGIIPYLATSFSTLFLAWDINYAHVHGMGYLVTEQTAQHLLHILEPLEIGYGAVILSFLGAIHWGLEFAEYGGKHSRRYLVGLISTVLGWSTTLLPLHSALLTQFAGFTGMYFFDSTASTQGYAPSWYATYRFVLTFLVGAAIVITLVGRGQIGDFSSHTPAPADRFRALRESQRYNEEKERKDILRKKQLEERKQIEEEERNTSAAKDTGRLNATPSPAGSSPSEGKKDNPKHNSESDALAKKDQPATSDDDNDAKGQAPQRQ